MSAVSLAGADWRRAVEPYVGPNARRASFQLVTTLGLLQLALTMLVVLAAVDIAYVALAARARLLLRSPRALRLVNRISATAMGGAAAAIASR